MMAAMNPMRFAALTEDDMEEEDSIADDKTEQVRCIYIYILLRSLSEENLSRVSRHNV